MKIRIGTRGSPLALAQTQLVVDALRGVHLNLEPEVIIISTTGDVVTDRPLAEIGGKALFAKEIQSALLNNSIDIAIHSLKDLEMPGPAELCIGAVLPREEPWDVLVSREGKTLTELPSGSIVGSCAPRRAAQILALRPDLRIQPMRGNVGTRLSKVDSGEYDATVMALAGLKRLGLTDRITQKFTLDEMVPGVAQGAIAIECRESNHPILKLIKAVNDPVTEWAVTAERQCVLSLDGHCKTPIGTYAKDNKLTAMIAIPEMGRLYRVEVTGEDPVDMGQRAAAAIREKAGADYMVWKAC